MLEKIREVVGKEFFNTYGAIKKLRIFMVDLQEE